MKNALILALGILTGLAFSRIPHYIDQYANHSLPPEYTGEKATMRYYFNGGVVPAPVADEAAFVRT